MSRSLLLLAFLPAVASAAEGLDSAFPVLPCPDGWAGCVVDGQPLTPELVAANGAQPSPSDWPVSWFTLQSTPAFSPFGGLSEYAGGNEPPVEASLTVPQPVSEAPAGVRGDCDDESIEPPALLGKLSDAQIDCLEARYQSPRDIHDQDHASLLLITNAWSSDDKEGWEALAKRHVDEVDASHAELNYKLALYAAKRDHGQWDVIKHADASLAYRTLWHGETFSKRVSNLYKLRASAAQSLWNEAELAADRKPSVATRVSVASARARVLRFSQEWNAFQRAQDLDPELAMKLCEQAALSPRDCATP